MIEEDIPENPDPEDFPPPPEARPMETAPLGEDIEVWHAGERYGPEGAKGWAVGWIEAWGTEAEGTYGAFFFAPEADDGFACMFGGWRPKSA